MKLKDITTISSLDCRLKQYVIESIDEPDGPVNIYTAGATVHHCYSDDIEGITQITGNCVLLPTMGGVQREETIKYTEGRFIQTGNVILGLPYKIDIDSRWLWYRLCSNLKGLRKCYIGRHVLNLDRTLLMNYEIGEVPAIDEQKRIAGILDKYLEIIEQLKDEQGLRKKQYEYYRDGLLKFPRRSRLDDLINVYCPEGVEYVRLGDVVNYKQPNKYIVKSTDYDDSYNIPVLTAGQSFILGYTNEKYNLYDASKENPVIIFDDFTGSFKWVDFPFKVKSSAMKLLTANIEYTTIRYIFHCMGYIDFSSTEHKRLWISIYSNFKIPLPPLPVQEEIVRILDTFTELTEEIGNETELRIKQFNYYRKELMKQ